LAVQVRRSRHSIVTVPVPALMHPVGDFAQFRLGPISESTRFLHRRMRIPARSAGRA